MYISVNTSRFQIPRGLLGAFFVIVCPGDRALVYPGALDGLVIFDLLLRTTFVWFFCLFGLKLKPRFFPICSGTEHWQLELELEFVLPSG